MGRGDSKTAAQRSAQSLLFGPRTGRVLSPEAKKRRTIEKRKITMKSRQRGHARQLADATDELINGNSIPLQELLAEPTPKGAIGAEKQALREVSKTLLNSGAVRQSHTVKFDSEPMAGGVDAIDTLQQLRRRCDERKVPKKTVIEPLRQLVGTQAYVLGYQNALDQLRQRSDEIGAVPKASKAQSGWSYHLVGTDGRTVCGEELSKDEDPKSILNCRSVYCRPCFDAVEEGAQTDKMEPSEWLQEVDNEGCALISYPFPWREPQSGGSGQEICDYSEKKILDNLASMFDSYGAKAPEDWRISSP